MYKLKEISAVLGCELPDDGGRMISHLLTDSRSLLFPNTSLFFAILTSRNDGHRYIGDLYAKGVRAFVVHKETDLDMDSLQEAIFIPVNDSLAALQKLAIFHRSHFHFPVIGITGSNGKTVVKEWLHHLLHHRYKIVRSPKSFNSQIGVPLSIWPMRDTDELGLFEAGISTSGEMEKLEKMIRPTIGVLTNIGPAHAEGFANLQQKIREKLRLFRNSDWLVYGKDDPALHLEVARVVRQREMDGLPALKLFNWSAVSDANMQLLNLFKEEDFTTITANFANQTQVIRIPFTDEASIENAINCWCVLMILGVPQLEIAGGMEKLEPLAMRLELKKALNHCLLINDSYNADLHSLTIALDFMVQQKPFGKKTTILSDILQSGQPERELYEKVAQALAHRQIHRLIAIGERMFQHRAIFQQVQGLEILFYPSTDAFLADFQRMEFRDEMILLKGSRVFAFEKIDRKLELQTHQTVLEINLQAMVHNLKWYQQQLKKSTRVMAMVKAFAYGSGSFEIAQLLQYHKVDYLAVAYADEAVELRKAGIVLPIMIMNPEPSTFGLMLEYQLEPDLYAPEILDAFLLFLEKQGIREFPVHIELETGMNRLGFSEEQMPFLIQKLKNRTLKVQSVFSHLSASESFFLDEFTAEQAGRFNAMCQDLSSVLEYDFLKHIGNTAAIARHPELQYDMVRLGIGLYGADANNTNLRQASTLKTTIAQIKHLKTGESVGYGRNGKVLQPMKLATIRIGYADGYPRQLSNGNGKVLIHGCLAPVVGWICMDMTMVDITAIPHVEVGDEVILFGEALPLSTVASWAGTISYELMAGVSQRVKRVYFNE